MVENMNMKLKFNSFNGRFEVLVVCTSVLVYLKFIFMNIAYLMSYVTPWMEAVHIND